MSLLSSLLAWANVPFSIALGIAVAFVALQATGLLGLLAGGGEHDADADVDGDVDADAGHDGAHEGDADGEHGEHEGGSSHGGLFVPLGVGRVPLSVIWQTYALTFGFAGVAMNAIYLQHAGALPAHTLIWTLPGATLFGYASTAAIARVLGRVFSNPAQEATSRRDLVGHTGVVISSKVNAEFGEVRLRDKSGHVVRVICETREPQPIAEGREVVVVEYDDTRDKLLVAPLDTDEPARAQSRPRRTS